MSKLVLEAARAGGLLLFSLKEGRLLGFGAGPKPAKLVLWVLAACVLECRPVSLCTGNIIIQPASTARRSTLCAKPYVAGADAKTSSTVPAVGVLSAAVAAGEEADWWVRSSDDRDLTERGLARGDVTPADRTRHVSHVRQPTLGKGVVQSKLHLGLHLIQGQLLDSSSNHTKLVQNCFPQQGRLHRDLPKQSGRTCSA